MEKDLLKFMENVHELKLKIGEGEVITYCYEDKNGTYGLIPSNNILDCVSATLLCGVSYSELTEPEYKKALFNQQIEDLDYKEIEATRTVDKFETTHKENDKGILTNVKKKAKAVWKVSNYNGASKCFTTKDEALKLAKDINKKILEQDD